VSPEGVYLATSDEVQGLVAQGRTIQETIEIARDVAKKLIEAQQSDATASPLVPARDMVKRLKELGLEFHRQAARVARDLVQPGNQSLHNDTEPPRRRTAPCPQSRMKGPCACRRGACELCCCCAMMSPDWESLKCHPLNRAS
jgi:predicted RNase H-like HicB family nuclease